jgi:hypothetical protein
MPPKEKRVSNSFTGLFAYYENGTIIEEKNNYYSTKFKKTCATNWAEIDKSQLIALELFWKGSSKIKISKEEYPDIKPEDWFFSHYGYFDMKDRKTLVIARNIGIKLKDHIKVYSVDENTGNIKIETRPL